MKNTIQCPISTDKVDENVVRTVAFLTLTIALAGLFLHTYIIMLLLAADFALRAFTPGHLSPLKNAAKILTRQLHFAKKPTDAEPKKFAAALGMVFSLLIASLQLFGFQLAAEVVGAILVSCAILEAGFNICLGCIVYTYTILPFHKGSVQ